MRRHKRGRFAASALSVLCIGGVLTLFSQSRLGEAQGPRTLNFDRTANQEIFESVLPAALSPALPEAEAASETAAEDEAASKKKADEPKRLRLR